MEETSVTHCGGAAHYQQRDLLTQRSDMASATGNEKNRNHFSLLSPEATAASKQLMK